MKRILCLLIGHNYGWNSGEPECNRCWKPIEYNDFMQKHGDKKVSVRFRW